MTRSPPPIAAKINRLSSSPAAKPRVLDLLSGCGGLSLGFQAAGCEITAAVEIDDLAARSHASNFFRDAPTDQLEHHARSRDISQIEPEELTEELGLGPPGEAFDIVVGGPPCQAFARVGRRDHEGIKQIERPFRLALRIASTVTLTGPQGITRSTSAARWIERAAGHSQASLHGRPTRCAMYRSWRG